MRLSKVFLTVMMLFVTLSFVNCANQIKNPKTLKTVYFDLDKSYVRNDQIPVMENNVAAMRYRTTRASEKSRYGRRKSHENNIVIEGHCDERGSNEYNIALGHRRADSAKNYMVSKGINPNRLRTTSFGEDRPTCRGSNESCWSQNRRAEFVIE